LIVDCQTIYFHVRSDVGPRPHRHSTNLHRRLPIRTLRPARPLRRRRSRMFRPTRWPRSHGPCRPRTRKHVLPRRDCQFRVGRMCQGSGGHD
jgi:hypothetical protein